MEKEKTIAEKSVGEKDVWGMPLDELLKIVDSLWMKKEGGRLYSYDYSIGRFPHGWQFNVVNSWQNWSDKNLTHNFGAYSTIEGCLAGFLEYIIKNKIEPKNLTDK